MSRRLLLPATLRICRCFDEDTPISAACTGNNVNLRAEPGKTGKRAATLAKGGKLCAIGLKEKRTYMEKPGCRIDSPVW